MTQLAQDFATCHHPLCSRQMTSKEARKRAAADIAGLGLPTRKVARLLEKIAAIPEVLDMNFSRWDFRASIDEAFLKVQETRRLPTHDGGEAVWEFANLGKVFKYLIAERPVLKALFQDLQRRCPSTPENPWSLVRGEVYSPVHAPSPLNTHVSYASNAVSTVEKAPS